jgi:hypothetical protein
LFGSAERGRTSRRKSSAYRRGRPHLAAAVSLFAREGSKVLAGSP